MIHPVDVSLILAHGLTGYGGEYLGGAGLYFAALHGSAACLVSVHDAENAVVGVHEDAAADLVFVGAAVKLAGSAALALHHARDVLVSDFALAERQQQPGIGVGYPVAQRAEHAAFGVVKRDGAHARDSVPEPQTKAKLPVGGPHGRDGELLRFAASVHRHRNRIPVESRRRAHKVFGAMDVLPAKLRYHVPGLKPRVPRRIRLSRRRVHLAHAGHHHSVRGHFDAHRSAAGHQLLRRRRYGQRRERKHQRQSQQAPLFFRCQKIPSPRGTLAPQ